MEQGSNNIEQIKAQEAAMLKGQAIINGDQKSANRHSRDEATLSGQAQLHEQNVDSYGNNKDEKAKQQTLLLGIANQQIAESHTHFMANGFNSSSDFYSYGNMLNNDAYWQYLQDNPDEYQKMANRFAKDTAQMVADGDMTLEEVEKARRENKRLDETLNRGDFEGRLHELGVTPKSQIADMTDTASNLASDEKLDSVIQNNRKYESSLEKAEVICDTHQETRIDRRVARKELKTKVLDTAEDERGIRTDRQDAKDKHIAQNNAMDDIFANDPEFQKAQENMNKSGMATADDSASLPPSQVAKSPDIDKGASAAI